MGDGLQEGPFPNSFSCGLSLHGSLSTGLLPLGPAVEAQFMRPSFIAQIPVVSVVSYCLCELQALLLFPSAVNAVKLHKQLTLGTSMLKKTVENEGG